VEEDESVNKEKENYLILPQNNTKHG